MPPTKDRDVAAEPAAKKQRTATGPASSRATTETVPPVNNTPSGATEPVRPVVDTGIVPTPVVATEALKVAIEVTVPELPSTPEQMLKCDVPTLMRSIMLWCRRALVQRLSSDPAFKDQFVQTEFWRERPLQISNPTNAKTLVGFKPPWQQAQCMVAMEQRQVYEAAINIDWVQTDAADAEHQHIAGDTVTYASIDTIRCNTMVIPDEVLGTVKESAELPVEHRRYFSFALACHTHDLAVLKKDAFCQELVLLDGHAFVWAWWLHLYYLLTETSPAPSWSVNNTIALRQHLDMGLGATAQVRVERDITKLATWSAERAGTKEFVSQQVADTFPAFVRKTSLILQDVPSKQKMEHFLPG